MRDHDPGLERLKPINLGDPLMFAVRPLAHHQKWRFVQ